MCDIKDLKPKAVWSNFHALTQVPRPSGHLEKVQQFLLDYAKSIGVEAFKDSANNIVMRKPAVPGCENKEGIILQAHMDMVPQKSKDSNHNFEADPIIPYIDGEWVRAKGTTLGADDGMGIAAIMAVLASNDIKHGPIEALCTADEETGMYGANDLPAGELQGKILLNLDTEVEGELTIGSAGGLNITGTLGYKEVETDTEDAAVKITIKGLKGGHSGIEIGLGRANSNKLMVRIVRDAIEDLEARLASWHGGNMRNAIPFECETILTLPKENVDALKELVDEYCETFNFEYKGIEEGILVKAEDVATPAMELPEEIQDNLIGTIYAIHDGVIRNIPSIPTVVETSSNLAIVDIEDGEAMIKILARSSSETMKSYIASTLQSSLNMAGMKVEYDGDYQGWDPNTESPLLKVMSTSYKELFGTEAKVQVVHAGLECSIILSKYPGLDIVSFGPTILSPHTTGECCNIASVERFWQLLVKTIEGAPMKN